MIARAASFSLAGLLLATCAVTPSPSASPDLRQQFAPGGTLRIGVNLGNPVVAQKGLPGGAPAGVGPELGRELGRRLGVPVSYVTYDNAGKMADAVKQDAWDVAFLAIDPGRAADIGFTAPYVQVEGTYLVARESPIRHAGEVDRPGIKVAVGDKTAYDLFLTRNLKHAELLKASTSEAAVALFRERKLDAVAGVKNPLVTVASRDPSVRVVEGSFMVIGQAAGVPKARALALAYLRDFIEEMKASGFVARALQASGVNDATVAGPAR
jgi:polar amino acid transport system substrate-binding protein